MAEYGSLMTLTLKAAADLSAKRYFIMRQSAEGSCNMASLGTTSQVIGVLQNKPESGENATIADSGKSKVVAGAAIAQNLQVASDGTGRAVACGSGDMSIGRALQAAGAAGEVISVRLHPPIRWAGAA